MTTKKVSLHDKQVARYRRQRRNAKREMFVLNTLPRQQRQCVAAKFALISSQDNVIESVSRFCF